ncbi:hypothetical protein T440DRAFT_489452 [Plenodomus tracheiphilus IPT5]|uniref:Large ribosomal subunit protein eL14 domain-containing protein n=1 Tax=Plenodomus tracheiphilus IPT5 TaxID=1408161 RepID=A0A6A7B656_9PLEO|nr:hypothetical protein T440DRAFT_489452 [Plenodomus tracheiphilus IPT5]
MELTPIKIRGKKRRYTAPPQKVSSAAQAASDATTQSTDVSKRLGKTKVKKPTTTSAMPTLQGLPQELLEIIFLYSMNIALPRCSPTVGRKLSSRAVTMEFTMQSFFHTVDHKTNYRIRDRNCFGNPVLQSAVIASRFFTYDFFLAYVQRAHDALIKLRGKAWEETGIRVLGVEAFAGLWPYKFNQIVYLGFAEGFHIPEKLLHGPWTKEKASLLYVLGSMAGETAKTGIKEAVRQGNEYAIAALSVLLGVAKTITTDILRYTILHCDWSVNTLRHLLFNAQILGRDTSTDVLDFYDPKLWAWADSNGERGDMLKDMLKKAGDFRLEFFFEDADWRKIVSFPYGGSKFDTRTTFNDVVRELLEKLISQTDEMGDADITTSAWRLVEVGRVVLFNEGQYEGRLAAIVEIIDHKRVLIDGPYEKAPVPRQEIALAKLSLTPIVIPKLPRASGVGHVAKKWEEHKVQQKFDDSAWAKKRAALTKRRALNDFERFKVMKLRKQARHEVQKTFAKIRASAKA